jgi:hypothetical protein
MNRDGMTHVSEPVQKVLDSLEPDNVIGYTISDGHAFDGVTLHGFYPTFDEALFAAERDNREDWHVVPIWK